MSYKVFVILFFGSLLFAVSPALPVFVATTIANVNDCTLHAGFATPCVVWRMDLGETLYTLSMFAWVFLVTIPHGIIGAIMGLLGMGYLFIANKFNQRKVLNSNNQIV